MLINQTHRSKLRRRAFRLALVSWFISIPCVVLTCVTLQNEDFFFTYLFGAFSLLFVMIAGLGLGICEGLNYKQTYDGA